MSTGKDGREECACVEEDCHESAAWDRRRFLQTGGLGVTLAMLGLSSARVSALPITELQGAANANERRYPIPAADSVNIDRSAQTIVVRADGHMYVFALSCPHQNNAVKWVAKEHRFQCTKHDSQYRVDGLHTSGRATRNMDRYVPHRDGDAVVIDLRQWVQSDKDPAAWSAATVSV
ncbi:MAG TPA: Rieske 2Fe-2S domain-containing protein [Vicinamibacterales bacterium]|jgi:nitrite reductase/ring-hydroxylating ferredoxin subunit